MTKHVAFLLEERSARVFLENMIGRLDTSDLQFHFMVFEGKQDLEKNLNRKISGWVRSDTHFVVIRDQDNADCHSVKNGLIRRIPRDRQKYVTVRIACRELEAFFLGDWAAVAQAFAKPTLGNFVRKAKYRDPDAVVSPSRELQRELPGYQKVDGARRISKVMNPSANCSKSFQVLWLTLQKITDGNASIAFSK